jgi:hypothetical protein
MTEKKLYRKSRGPAISRWLGLRSEIREVQGKIRVAQQFLMALKQETHWQGCVKATLRKTDDAAAAVLQGARTEGCPHGQLPPAPRHKKSSPPRRLEPEKLEKWKVAIVPTSQAGSWKRGKNPAAGIMGDRGQL